MTLSGKRPVSGFFKLAEFLFFPSFCKLCDAFLERKGESVVCSACWDQIIGPASPCCPVCGRIMTVMGGVKPCAECCGAPPPFSMHRSCGPYEGKLKDIILLYKYRRFRILGPRLARMIDEILRDENDLWKGIDVVIPVPLHPSRLRERGFNQSGVMAKTLALLRGVPFRENCLLRIKNVPRQAGLTAKERKANVRDAFKVSREKDIRDKRVLLVDDVFTTGATIRECTLALKKAGVRDVKAVTVAQA